MVPRFKDRRPSRDNSKKGEEEGRGLKLVETEGYSTEQGGFLKR